MRIVIVISVFCIFACSQNKTPKQEKNKVMDSVPKIENNSLKMKNCDVYSEFIKLRDNIVGENIYQSAYFYNFPITDQNLISFIGSQDLVENQHVTLSNVDDFKTNFDKIFPSLFLSLLGKAIPNKDNNGAFEEVDWEDLYYHQEKLLERCKLQYRIDENVVVLKFIMEIIDKTEKYETIVEYFFTFKNCKLKFEKSIIAG